MNRGMSTSRLRLAAGLFGLLTIASPVLATFTYTSQDRSVYAHIYGFAPPPPQTIMAPDYNTWDATAHVQEFPNGGGYSTQHQHSELRPDLIYVTGDFAGKEPAFGGTGKADGQSLADIAFNLTSATDVSLTVNAVTNDNRTPDGSRTVSLTGPSTNISWNVNSYTGGWTGSRSQNMTLAPGSYDLHIALDSVQYASGYNPGNYVAAVKSFDVTLTPEPASTGAILLTASTLLRRRARRNRKVQVSAAIAVTF